MQFSFDELLRLISFGFWLPVATLLMFYIMFQFYRQMYDRRYASRERLEREHERKAREFEIAHLSRQQQRSVDEVSERLERQASFVERIYEEVPERVAALMERAMTRQLVGIGDQLNREILKELVASKHQNVEAVKSAPFSLGVASDVVDLELRQNIIREISHALFTPLSRIDAITTNVVNANPDESIVEKMADAKSAVEICYAYLAAYRKFMTVAESESYWSPQSLKEAIIKSANVYIGASAKKVVMKVEAPGSIPSLSTIYILAVLLPLIENAIDASLEGDPVGINVQDLANGVEANITNVLNEPFAGQEVFEPGFTTKKAKSDGSAPAGMNVHEGLGLTIVRNLLSAVPGGKISYKEDTASVTFTVKLPGRC